MINQRKFGVWMDSEHATIVRTVDHKPGALEIIAHINREEVAATPLNKYENKQKKMLQLKFFKEIATHLENPTHLHATGTGQVQEQFLRYLAETPQFNKTIMEESTASRMSDERLMEYFEEKFKLKAASHL
ncbi:MAG TPA: hypothetical protein VK489_06160 [Ferruginibacter sp.]|nr:hypothetical protein [Ferruginibacter sp.]